MIGCPVIGGVPLGGRNPPLGDEVVCIPEAEPTPELLELGSGGTSMNAAPKRGLSKLEKGTCFSD